MVLVDEVNNFYDPLTDLNYTILPAQNSLTTESVLLVELEEQLKAKETVFIRIIYSTVPRGKAYT